jgi:superfamily II DNA or RNA helicase
MVQPAIGDPIAAVIAQLHHFQVTSLRLTKERWDAGIRRQLIVLPTGSGKTVVLAVLPQYIGFNRRILVLVQRDTLAHQAKRQIEHWNPDAGEVGIEMGSHHAQGTEQVIVASVQTIGKSRKHKRPDGGFDYTPSRRLLAFNPDAYDAVIVDEAHHSITLSYRMIFRHFGFLDEKFVKTQPAPERLLFGVTATPRRLDGELLNQIYDKKTYEYPIEDAIREGWLVTPRCWRIRTTSNLKDIALKKGSEDLDLEKLAKVVNTPARNALVVREWEKRARDRKTICFAVDVKHAKALAIEFCKTGAQAAAIWSGDPDKKGKLKAFANGELTVLCNCELLTEGYDDRAVSCIVMGRPTASESLFKQCVGRGTRLEEGIMNLLEAIAQGKKVTKRDCIVIDVVDNTDKHSLIVTFAQAYGLPAEMDLEGAGLLEASDLVAKVKRKLSKAPGGAKKLDDSNVASMTELEFFSHEVLESEAEEVDLLKVRFDHVVLQYSQLQWHRLEHDHYVLPLPGKRGALYLYRNKDGYLVLDGTRLPSDEAFTDEGKIRNGPIGEGFVYADRKVYKLLGPKVFSMCDRNSDAAGWKARPATDAQKWKLQPLYKQQGRSIPPQLTQGEASLLITMMDAQAARA